MDAQSEKVCFNVTFGVRNDKNRGTLVENIEVKDNLFFFKLHDQPLDRHCEQVQSIIRKANVKRSKKIVVNIASFSYEYFFKDQVSFKGTALNSVNSQIGKVANTTINKEIGALKRSITMAANKPKKVEQDKQKITLKLRDAERYFQLERARRIHELYASPVGGSQSNEQVSDVAQPNGDTPQGEIHEEEEVEDVDLPSDSDSDL